MNGKKVMYSKCVPISIYTNFVCVFDLLLSVLFHKLLFSSIWMLYPGINFKLQLSKSKTLKIYLRLWSLLCMLQRSCLKKKEMLVQFVFLCLILTIQAGLIPFKLDMVEIRGKRGRKVPVILTREIRESIDLLNRTRATVGIPDENPYVFARPSRQSLGHIRAWDCMRKFVQECEPPFSNPNVVTSTKLRKYIATISQFLSLKETEVDWLGRHLGHHIAVHREFYRLHESTIKIVKVSKLLLAVDKGRTSKWAGKSLAEINIDNGKCCIVDRQMDGL